MEGRKATLNTRIKYVSGIIDFSFRPTRRCFEQGRLRAEEGNEESSFFFSLSYDSVVGTGTDPARKKCGRSRGGGVLL